MLSKRNDIQGLRGLAVILVILSHLPAGIKLPGGFVGVDIFFVISGFVIARMFIQQNMTGVSRTQAYQQFMIRRLSRLVTPLAAMIAGVVLLSFLFAPTTTLYQTTQSSIYSQGFLSNFYFLRNFDFYWNTSDLVNPFAHTWSLGITFQIYLVMPFLLLRSFVGASKQEEKKFLLQGVSSVSVASCLFFSYLLIAPDTSIRGYAPKSAAFYLPFTRFWEFGLGVIVALLVVNRSVSRERLFPFMRVGAWSLVVGGVLISNEIGELNLSVIPIALGTAVILGIGEFSTGSSKWGSLALRPLKWTGDRSYSIYLWHWPLLATASWISPTSHIWSVALLGVSIPIATLSYHYLERRRPVSRRRFSFRVVVPVAASVVLMVAASVVSTADWYSIPEPLSKTAMKFPDSSKPLGEVGNSFEKCQISDFAVQCKNFPAVQKEIVVIGDSLSYRAFTAVQLSAREHGLNASLFWNSGCSIELNSCRNSLFVNSIYDYLSKIDVIGLIVISNYDRESNRINAVEQDLGLKPLCDPMKPTSVCPLHLQKIQTFETSARQGLDQLHTYSNHVLIATPFPQQAEMPPICESQAIYARIISQNNEPCARTSVAWQKERQGLYPATITKVSAEKSFVQLWNPLDYFCDKGWCPAVINGGEQIMSDAIHWNLDASRFIYPPIDAFIDSVLK
jgi:peptidoglycan/LPS O-acetylase OafA/YrhL